MYKSVLVLIFGSLSLSGCATQANYEKTVDSWVGEPEAKLIASWGPPTNSYTSGDTTSISYAQSNGAVVRYGAVIPIGCTTNFTIVKHIITGWSFNGNACRQ